MVMIATRECKNYDNGILGSEKRAATIALREYEKSYSSISGSAKNSSSSNCHGVQEL